MEIDAETIVLDAGCWNPERACGFLDSKSTMDTLDSETPVVDSEQVMEVQR